MNALSSFFWASRQVVIAILEVLPVESLASRTCKDQAANRTKRCNLTTEESLERRSKKYGSCSAVLSKDGPTGELLQSNKPKERHHFRSDRCMLLLPLHGALLLCHHRVAVIISLVPWTNNGEGDQRAILILAIAHGEATQPYRAPS